MYKLCHKQRYNLSRKIKKKKKTKQTNERTKPIRFEVMQKRLLKMCTYGRGKTIQ